MGGELTPNASIFNALLASVGLSMGPCFLSFTGSVSDLGLCLGFAGQVLEAVIALCLEKFAATIPLQLTRC